jgi:hypothetical protein
MGYYWVLEALHPHDLKWITIISFRGIFAYILDKWIHWAVFENCVQKYLEFLGNFFHSKSYVLIMTKNLIHNYRFFSQTVFTLISLEQWMDNTEVL